jgi:hypothetical protein
MILYNVKSKKIELKKSKSKKLKHETNIFEK